MANTKAKRHTHKYHKIEIAYQKVWACALPTCNHYMPKHMEAMVPGKASLCWECGEEIILTPQNMQSDKPVCDDCAGIAARVAEIEKTLTH